MSGNTREGDVSLGGGQEVLRAANHLAHVVGLEADVHTEDFLNAFNSTGFFHRHGAANAFFSRLEDEADLALELVTHGGDNFSQSQANSHVAVVAAGVHGALVDRSEPFNIGTVISVRAFAHVVAVHVKANSQEGAVAAEIHISPEAGQAAFHLRH